MAKAAFKSPMANDIVLGAIKQCSAKVKREVTYKDLATVLNIHPSNVWFPLKKKRSWPVDRWLYALQALGCLSYQGDHIIISSTKLRKYQEAFNKIEQFEI